MNPKQSAALTADFQALANAALARGCTPSFLAYEDAAARSHEAAFLAAYRATAKALRRLKKRGSTAVSQRSKPTSNSASSAPLR
jgi:hypothetical protein